MDNIRSVLSATAKSGEFGGGDTFYTLRKIFDNKVICSISLIILYGALNYSFQGINFPGLSVVFIRPQICIPLLAGFILGPLSGFLVGFLGNFLGDILLGYNATYLFTWCVANGVLGLLMGFAPYRKRLISNPKQLNAFMLYLIFVNIMALSYVQFFELFQATADTSKFRYFFLPMVVSNTLMAYVSLPVILFALNKIKHNFANRLALLLFYLSFISVLLVSLLLIYLMSSFIVPGLSGIENLPEISENAISTLYCLMLIPIVIITTLSFAISNTVSKRFSKPINEITTTIKSLSVGKYNLDPIKAITERDDELGTLASSFKEMAETIYTKEENLKSDIKSSYRFLFEEDTTTPTKFIEFVLNCIETDESLRGQILSEYEGIGDGRSLKKIEAIKVIIYAAGFKEFMKTYETEDMQKLGDKGSLLDDEGLKILAAAVDLNIISRESLNLLNVEEDLTSDFAMTLLSKLYVLRGEHKNYIGHTKESEIYEKINQRIELYKLPVIENAVQKVLQSLLEENYISGYFIKERKFESHFNSDLSLLYLHNDIKHAKQLIALIKREDIYAKVQITPKISTFIYLKEWETPVISEKERYINLESGNYLVLKEEFDLEFEFEDSEEKKAFQNIILSYAKKREKIEEVSGEDNVIYSSWFVPSFVSRAEVESYVKIINNMIVDGDYIYCTFTSVEKSNELAVIIKEQHPEITLSREDLWVNRDFYEYMSSLTGN